MWAALAREPQKPLSSCRGFQKPHHPLGQQGLTWSGVHTCLKSPPSTPPHSLCSQDTSLLVAPPTFLSTVLPQGLCKCCSLCPRYLGNNSPTCFTTPLQTDCPWPLTQTASFTPCSTLIVVVSTHPLQTWFLCICMLFVSSLVAQLVKNPPPMQGTPVWFLGQEDPLKKE